MHILTFIIIYVLILIKFVIGEENNVCKNFIDYLHIKNNSNCWYNPDVNTDVYSITRLHGIPLETHYVTTEDGYTLTLFRLPNKNAKEVVVLEHPMTGTAKTYMITGNRSFAFTMYEAGYDVWLPNSRGTYYSQVHKTLSVYDPKYWDFSFEEIGKYDFPAEMEYIKNTTQRGDLILITYSMSGPEALIYGSIRPQHAADHVKVAICIGPTVMLSKDRLSNKLDNSAKNVFNVIGMGSMFFSYDIGRFLQRKFCVDHPFKVFCVYMTIQNAGGSLATFDASLVPALWTNNPTRVSLKVLLHYNQIGKSRRFQFYNYGTADNLLRYKRPTPPLYPLENTQVPYYFIYGELDASCPLSNVEMVSRLLPEKSKIYGKHMVKGYNHVDFFFARDNKEKVIDHIMEFIEKHF